MMYRESEHQCGIVRPPGLSILSYWGNVWRNLNLLWPMGVRFLMLTYQNTVLGWWWLIVRALLPTLGLIAIFQHVSALHSENLPYPLYVLSGMLGWTLFNMGLMTGTRCLRIMRRVHTRFAFPKVLCMFASMALPLFYSLSFFGLLCIAIVYSVVFQGFHATINLRILCLPMALMIIVLLVVGIICFTSIIFLIARDIRFMVGLVCQLWFYATPVIYPITILPPTWQIVVAYLNPMTPLVDLVRWSLFGGDSLGLGPLLTSIGLCLLIFTLGTRFVMRSEWVLRQVI
jgi:lipopolysaccharide transport system permease protein